MTYNTNNIFTAILSRGTRMKCVLVVLIIIIYFFNIILGRKASAFFYHRTNQCCIHCVYQYRYVSDFDLLAHWFLSPWFPNKFNSFSGEPFVFKKKNGPSVS